MHEERGATSANILLRLRGRLFHLSPAAEPRPAPHKVLTLASCHTALHRTVPVPGSSVGAEGEAEASCAVADLEQIVRTEEGLSFTPSQVVDRLQVIVDCNVAQLLPPLQSPPSPHEDNTCHQSQHKDGQNAGDGESGGGGLGSLPQSRLETGLERELAARTHEAFRTLAYWPREVGEASATILAWAGATGVGAHAAVLAGVPQGARAGVVVHAILASSGVLAGG